MVVLRSEAVEPYVQEVSGEVIGCERERNQEGQRRIFSFLLLLFGTDKSKFSPLQSQDQTAPICKWSGCYSAMIIGDGAMGSLLCASRSRMWECVNQESFDISMLLCSLEEGVEVVMSILARINCNGKNYQAKTVKNIF